MIIILPLAAFPLIFALTLLFVLVLPKPTFAGSWALRGFLAAIYSVTRVLLAILCAAGLWLTMTVAGNVWQGYVLLKDKPAAAAPAKPEVPA